MAMVKMVKGPKVAPKMVKMMIKMAPPPKGAKKGGAKKGGGKKSGG